MVSKLCGIFILTAILSAAWVQSVLVTKENMHSLLISTKPNPRATHGRWVALSVNAFHHVLVSLSEPPGEVSAEFLEIKG